jgi:hypothetical protein
MKATTEQILALLVRARADPDGEVHYDAASDGIAASLCKSLKLLDIINIGLARITDAGRDYAQPGRQDALNIYLSRVYILNAPDEMRLPVSRPAFPVLTAETQGVLGLEPAASDFDPIDDDSVLRGRLRFRELFALGHPTQSPYNLAVAACDAYSDTILGEWGVDSTGSSVTFESRHQRDTAIDCICALPPEEASTLLIEYADVLMSPDQDSLRDWEAGFMANGGVAVPHWIHDLFRDPSTSIPYGHEEIGERVQGAIIVMAQCGFSVSRQDAAQWLWDRIAFAQPVPMESATSFLQVVMAHGVAPCNPVDESRKAELARHLSMTNVASIWEIASRILRTEADMRQVIEQASAAADTSRTPAQARQARAL